MASCTEAEDEELLETRLVQVRHFDETTAEFARSVVADCNGVQKSIEVARQNARSQYSLLSILNDETAEAAPKIAHARKKRKTPGRRINDKGSSLAYLAACLGIEENEPPASASKSNRQRCPSTISTTQASRTKKFAAWGSTLGEPRAHVEEKKIEPLEVVLTRFRTAGDKLQASREAIEDLIRAHERAAPAEQVDGVFDSLLDYWLCLCMWLAQDDGNTNDSMLSEGSSFLDDSSLDLHTHDDLLATQEAAQVRSIQQRQQQKAKLTKDLEALKKAVATLKVQNLKLNAQIEANHMKGKDSVCRTLRSKKSKIRRASELLQPTSAKARASLASAEVVPSAGGGDTSPKLVNGKSERRQAVLQETFKSLRDGVTGSDTADALERQTRRMHSARQSLDKAARSIREGNLIGASNDTMHAYERLMKQDKAILLLDSTVKGRTFADWLPDVMVLAKRI